MISQYSEAMSFLLNRTNFECKPASSYRHSEFKLERMKRLLRELDHPERTPVVHIAGTKGKGSVAHMVAACLQASGYRTGLFLSPHLETYEERIQVDGSPIPRERVVELAERLRRSVDRMAVHDNTFRPTFFELTTSLAWLWYQQQAVDIAVLEVGLGGRLDSTNICRPEVTAVTSVGLDHTQQLGETIAEIAAEKAGILKPGVPAVSGCSRPEARRVVNERAASLGVRVWEVDREIRWQPQQPEEPPAHYEVTTPVRTYPRIGLPLLGIHQGRNLATALGVLDCLRERGWHLEESPLYEALSRIRIPGRQELISDAPPILLDVAHNADSTQALTATIASSRFRRLKKVLLFGSSRDKDIRTQLQMLEPAFETIILTRTSARERSCAPEDIVEICGWEHRPNVIVCPSTTHAWERAVSLAGSDKLLVISGSFYLTGEMRGIAASHQIDRQSPLRVTA